MDKHKYLLLVSDGSLKCIHMMSCKPVHGKVFINLVVDQTGSVNQQNDDDLTIVGDLF